MTDVKLKCSCGKVQGVIKNVSPNNGNRVVCCCSDCQAFAQALGRENDVLDEFGGTDLYQTSQSQIEIMHGAEHLQCLRLKPKGLLRWYTDCCNTPIGNALNAKMPFFGIIHSFMSGLEQPNQTLGPVLAYVQTQDARKRATPPFLDYPHYADKFPIGITFRIITKMLGWKLRGMGKPTPFFDQQTRPVAKPRIVENNTAG